MAQPQLARCGLDCTTCPFREKNNCPGCHKADGTMFWGKCTLALCSIGKGIEHCGLCDQFPCDLLKSYSYAKEHGDNGQRIRNLEALRNKHGAT